MSLTVTYTAGEFLHEPEEWLHATIQKIEEADDYGFGPTLRWTIQVDGDDYETDDLCSMKLTPRSKLYGWLSGIDPNLIPKEDGDSVDLADIEGRDVEVMFRHDKREDGTVREKIDRMRAPKNVAAKKKPTPKNKQGNDADYAPGEEPF